jgi:hypothetical protein
VPVAAAVKVTRTETIASAAPQESKSFLLEIVNELRRVRNDCGIRPRRGGAPADNAVDFCAVRGGGDLGTGSDAPFCFCGGTVVEWDV